MHIALFEAFFAGSHRQWALGLKQHLPCKVDLYTLEGRHWKWRMHGAAVTFAEQLRASLDRGQPLPQVLLVSSMVDLCVFKALLPVQARDLPLVYYFHENQLVYPWSPTDPDVQLKRDRHYGFIHFTSALAADSVWFNSGRHRDQFIAALPPFLSEFPDHKLLETVSAIKSKAEVVHLGLDLFALRADAPQRDLTATRPIILWNHRWEYDKNPEAFFQSLFHLADANYDFDLVITGEQFAEIPDVFQQAYNKLGRRILHFGYCESRQDYALWLHRAHLLPVTSTQDFFGISVVEAMACGVRPLLPYGLAYEEHLNDPQYFYHAGELTSALKTSLDSWRADHVFPEAEHMMRYDWSVMKTTYVNAFEGLLHHSPNSQSPAHTSSESK